MEPFPAEWRTVGKAAKAPASDRSAHEHGGGRAAVERSHLLIAFVAAAAVAAGVVTLAGTLWLTTPHGEVDIAAHAAAATGNRAAGLQDPVVRGSPAAALAASVPIDRPAEIVVDVEGAVRRPGIQRLPAGSRVGDAIAAAGGYGDRADVVAAAQTINLAEALLDGAKVRVPTLGDNAAAGPTAAAAASATPGAAALIDLNHADEGQLESLPGVGPVTAGKIIDARTTAAFATIDDLATRGVVGPSTLEKLRPLVTVTP
jgi:competence protein ComEA